jgi:hypothetical protein
LFLAFHFLKLISRHKVHTSRDVAKEFKPIDQAGWRERVPATTMGVTRAHIVKNDALEGMLGEFVGGGKGGGKAGRAAARHSSRLVAALTCLQLAFAIYATFLLYYMSPAVDLRAKPDFAWATRIAQHWKQLMAPPPAISRG